MNNATIRNLTTQELIQHLESTNQGPKVNLLIRRAENLLQYENQVEQIEDQISDSIEEFIPNLSVILDQAHYASQLISAAGKPLEDLPEPDYVSDLIASEELTEWAHSLRADLDARDVDDLPDPYALAQCWIKKE